MRWFLLLPLLLALSLDFAVIDAPLLPTAQQRHVEADDEEESVPSRTVRVRRSAPSVTAALPAHRYVVPRPVPRPTQHAARTVRWTDPPPWLGPIAGIRLSSPGSASPPDAH